MMKSLLGRRNTPVLPSMKVSESTIGILHILHAVHSMMLLRMSTLQGSAIDTNLESDGGGGKDQASLFPGEPSKGYPQASPSQRTAASAAKDSPHSSMHHTTAQDSAARSRPPLGGTRRASIYTQ